MEQFSIVALLTPLFCLLMIFRAVSLYWKQKQTWRELMAWILLWFGIGFVAFYPSMLDVLPPVVGIKSGVNVLSFFGFVVLFYGFFRLFVKVEELEGKIVKMNRARALRENEQMRNPSTRPPKPIVKAEEEQRRELEGNVRESEEERSHSGVWLGS